MSEAGGVTIITTAVTAQDTVVTFNNHLPKTPIVKVTVNVHTAGVIVGKYATTTGVGTAPLRLYSTGGAAMTAYISVALNWSTKVDD